MGAVDLKSMERSSRIRSANVSRSRSAHGVWTEEESELSEGESAHGVGEGEVLGFNMTYGNDRGMARRPARGGNRRWSVYGQVRNIRLPSGLSGPSYERLWSNYGCLT